MYMQMQMILAITHPTQLDNLFCSCTKCIKLYKLT